MLQENTHRENLLIQEHDSLRETYNRKLVFFTLITIPLCHTNKFNERDEGAHNTTKGNFIFEAIFVSHSQS